MSSYHISTSIPGALAMNAKDFAKAYKGVFSDDDGKVLSIGEARRELEKELALGHMIVPSGGCDNYSWETGCLGHDEEKPKEYKIANFVTGEDVPAGRVPNSQTGEPTAAYVDGWAVCMEGHPKVVPFNLSNQQAADWLEGYEAAERD